MKSSRRRIGVGNSTGDAMASKRYLQKCLTLLENAGQFAIQQPKDIADSLHVAVEQREERGYEKLKARVEANKTAETEQE